MALDNDAATSTPMSTAAGTIPLAHVVQGNGPLLVLIHGITENRHSFDPLLPMLQSRYRVLAVDLRGHGDSPPAAEYPLDAMAADVAAEVAQVVDGLGSESGEPGQAPLVVGHSLGGIVAAAYAVRFPVRGVVNIDQSLDLAAMQEQVQAVEGLLRSDAFPAVITGMFAQMTGQLPPDEQQRVGALRRMDQDVVLGIWSPLFHLGAPALAAMVDDLVTPAAPYPYLQIDGLPSGEHYPEWLAHRIPGALVEDWGLLGHYPHLCEPDRFVARVAEFDPAV